MSQLRDLLGLHIPGKLPGDFFSLLHVLATNLASINVYAVGLGTSTARSWSAPSR